MGNLKVAIRTAKDEKACTVMFVREELMLEPSAVVKVLNLIDTSR